MPAPRGNSNARKYSADETVFDNIDSEEKAWLLGLIVSDGCLYERRMCVQIALKHTDIDALEKAKIILKYSGPIYTRLARTYTSLKGIAYHHSESKTLCIYSKKIYFALINLGVMPRKSTKETLPKVHETLLPHLVRGTWDGDGAVYNNNNNRQQHHWRVALVGSAPLLTSIADIAYSVVGVKKPVHKCKGNWHSFTLCSRNALKWCDYMYKDATVYMDRKYQKYLEMKKYYAEVDMKRAEKCGV